MNRKKKIKCVNILRKSNGVSELEDQWELNTLTLLNVNITLLVSLLWLKRIIQKPQACELLH